MMWRIYSWMERLIARHDRKCGLKTRDEAFSELAQTYLELQHLKLDLESIPPLILDSLREMFSKDFHRATAQRPKLSLPEQEKHLQKYIDLALKLDMSARELLDLDPVEFRALLVNWVIGNELFITEIQSGVSRAERTTLLHSVSDAAEKVGL